MAGESLSCLSPRNTASLVACRFRAQRHKLTAHACPASIASTLRTQRVPSACPTLIARVELLGHLPDPGMCLCISASLRISPQRSAAWLLDSIPPTIPRSLWLARELSLALVVIRSSVRRATRDVCAPRYCGRFYPKPRTAHIHTRSITVCRGLLPVER